MARAGGGPAATRFGSRLDEMHTTSQRSATVSSTNVWTSASGLSTTTVVSREIRRLPLAAIRRSRPRREHNGEAVADVLQFCQTTSIGKRIVGQYRASV